MAQAKKLSGILEDGHRQAITSVDVKLKVDELFLRWIATHKDELNHGLKEVRKTRRTQSLPCKLGVIDRSSTDGGRPSRVEQRKISPPPPVAPLSPRTLNRRYSDIGDHRREWARPPSDDHLKPTEKDAIPRFYFPYGKPKASRKLVSEKVMEKVSSIFSENSSKGGLRKSDFAAVCEACSLPFYWKSLLHHAASNGERKQPVTFAMFEKMWKKLTLTYHDDASRFVHLLTCFKRSYLVFDDFKPLIQDVIEDHPGLSFLSTTPEFHSRYVLTVISRIFYTVNRSWSGRITIPELRRSRLLQVIASLEHNDSINAEEEFFSYEHFYVIYCKFWELDSDHDLLIDIHDLLQYGENALTKAILERVLDHTTDPCIHQTAAACGELRYTEFVWFILSEEDKTTRTSIEYWFRCMDLDGDGYISIYEMEHFYQDQLERMRHHGIDPLPFVDCVCQMMDMIRPREPDKIALRDLKACGFAGVFFNTFFNLDKFLQHEQRDPFNKDEDEDSGTEWQIFARLEYGLLVAGEQGNDDSDEYDSRDEYADTEEKELLELMDKH